jgi:hypothetical protein
MLIDAHKVLSQDQAAYVHTMRDNADRFTQSAKSGPTMFVQQGYHSPLGMSRAKEYGYESFTLSMHYK